MAYIEQTSFYPFRCSVCGQSFHTLAILAWHQEHDHISVLENVEIERLRSINADLLEALRDLVEVTSSSGYLALFKSEIEAANATIAKAESNGQKKK